MDITPDTKKSLLELLEAMIEKLSKLMRRKIYLQDGVIYFEYKYKTRKLIQTKDGLETAGYKVTLIHKN